MPNELSPYRNYQPGDKIGRLFDYQYQNALKRMAQQVSQDWDGFEGSGKPDYELREPIWLIRITGKTLLSDGTSQYTFSRVRSQDLGFTGNTSGPLLRDDANADTEVLSDLYAYNLGNCQDVPIDGSVVVEASPGQAGRYLTFKYDVSDMTIGQVVSVSANGSISWVEIEQGSTGTYASRTFGLSGNETVNWATVLDSNLTVQAGDRGIFKRGYCEGGVRVVVTGTVSGDAASAQHGSQELYVENVVDGTFKLRVEGVDTGEISWNSTTELGTEINTTLGGNASVSVTGNGTHADPWNVTFSDYVARSPFEADIRGLKSTQIWTYIGGVRTPSPIYADYVVENLGVSGTNSTYTSSNGTLQAIQLTNVIGQNVTFPANGSLVLIASANTSIYGMWQVSAPGNMTKAASYNQSRTLGESVFVRKSIDLSNGTPNHNSTVWTLTDHPTTEYRHTSRALNTTITGRVAATGYRPVMAYTTNASGSNRASGRISDANLTLGSIQDNGNGAVTVHGALHLKYNPYVAGTGNATTASPLWNYNTASGADNSNSAISPNYMPIVGNGTFQVGTSSTEMNAQLVGGIPEGALYAVTNVGNSNITLTWNSSPTQNLTLATGTGALFIKNAGANATSPTGWTPIGFGVKPKTFNQLANETYGTLTNGQVLYHKNNAWVATENSTVTVNGSLPNGAFFWWDEANQKLVSLGYVPTAIGTLLVWNGSEWTITDTPAYDGCPLISDANSTTGVYWKNSPSGNLTWTDNSNTTHTIEIENGLITSFS